MLAHKFLYNGPLAKVWVDELQSHFEIAPEWGRKSPLTTFASGSNG